MLVILYDQHTSCKLLVALCDRYPDDVLGAMIYGRILALYLLERHGEAVAALAEAKRRSPRIAKMLTAKKPRMPELQAGVTTLGALRLPMRAACLQSCSF